MFNDDFIINLIESAGIWGALLLLGVIAVITYILKSKNNLNEKLVDTVDRLTLVQETNIKAIKEATEEIRKTNNQALRKISELIAKVETVMELRRDKDE